VKGKIVLIPFPFTDLTAAKLRPALAADLLRRLSDVFVVFEACFRFLLAIKHIFVVSVCFCR